MSRLLHRSLLAGALALSLVAPCLPSLAQPGLRNSFPGRRVGGGTRGECAARLIAHLVPANSVYAAGGDRWLGILQGPSDKPQPVQVSFRPQNPPSAPVLSSLTLPAVEVGIVLLKQPPITGPTLWESAYQCGGSQPAATDDPLSFVTADSPPALTLLVKDPEPADASVQSALQNLHKQCGASVSREDVERLFALEDLMRDTWPARIPVRCPG